MSFNISWSNLIESSILESLRTHLNDYLKESLSSSPLSQWLNYIYIDEISFEKSTKNDGVKTSHSPTTNGHTSTINGDKSNLGHELNFINDDDSKPWIEIKNIRDPIDLFYGESEDDVLIKSLNRDKDMQLIRNDDVHNGPYPPLYFYNQHYHEGDYEDNKDQSNKKKEAHHFSTKFKEDFFFNHSFHSTGSSTTGDLKKEHLISHPLHRSYSTLSSKKRMGQPRSSLSGSPPFSPMYSNHHINYPLSNPPLYSPSESFYSILKRSSTHKLSDILSPHPTTSLLTVFPQSSLSPPPPSIPLVTRSNLYHSQSSSSQHSSRSSSVSPFQMSNKKSQVPSDSLGTHSASPHFHHPILTRSKGDIQLDLDIRLSTSMIRCVISTELSLNTPVQSFISLPIKLKLTSLQFEAHVVVALIQDNVYIALEDNESSPFIFDISLIADIGDPNQQVLKNIAKLEKLIVDQVYSYVRSELTIPNYLKLTIEKNV